MELRFGKNWKIPQSRKKSHEKTGAGFAVPHRLPARRGSKQNNMPQLVQVFLVYRMDLMTAKTSMKLDIGTLVLRTTKLLQTNSHSITVKIRPHHIYKCINTHIRENSSNILELILITESQIYNSYKLPVHILISKRKDGSVFFY